MAIRARQARCLFVCCETEQIFAALLARAWQLANLHNSSLGIRLSGNENEVIQLVSPEGHGTENGTQSAEAMAA